MIAAVFDKAEYLSPLLFKMTFASEKTAARNLRFSLGVPISTAISQGFHGTSHRVTFVLKINESERCKITIDEPNKDEVDELNKTNEYLSYLLKMHVGHIDNLIIHECEYTVAGICQRYEFVRENRKIKGIIYFVDIAKAIYFVETIAREATLLDRSSFDIHTSFRAHNLVLRQIDNVQIPYVKGTYYESESSPKFSMSRLYR